jgi:hypothetical protein
MMTYPAFVVLHKDRFKALFNTRKEAEEYVNLKGFGPSASIKEGSFKGWVMMSKTPNRLLCEAKEE